MQTKTLNPLSRNTSAEKEIAELDIIRSEYLLKRQKLQIELDKINADISSVEAQIANIIIHKPKSRKRRRKI